MMSGRDGASLGDRASAVGRDGETHCDRLVKAIGVLAAAGAQMGADRDVFTGGDGSIGGADPASDEDRAGVPEAERNPMMKPLEYPFVLRNAVGREFLEYVTNVTLKNEKQFNKNPAGAQRKFMTMDYVTREGDDVLFEMKQKLANDYGLGDYRVPPDLKDFIGYITEGGSVHPHTDPDLPGQRHVRINVLIKQSRGCIPLLDGMPISVAEGDAWLNLASQCMHATTPVKGPGYRSALSFGYQIARDRGDELYETHNEWLAKVRGIAQ